MDSLQNFATGGTTPNINADIIGRIMNHGEQYNPTVNFFYDYVLLLSTTYEDYHAFNIYKAD